MYYLTPLKCNWYQYPRKRATVMQGNRYMKIFLIIYNWEILSILQINFYLLSYPKIFSGDPCSFLNQLKFVWHFLCLIYGYTVQFCDFHPPCTGRHCKTHVGIFYIPTNHLSSWKVTDSMGILFFHMCTIIFPWLHSNQWTLLLVEVF